MYWKMYETQTGLLRLQMDNVGTSSEIILLSGMQEHMLLHTRQSAIQNNMYQVSHKYSFSP